MGHVNVRDPRAAPWAAFAITVLAALALAVAHGAPLPRIHDEWSYVLGGDTFASFRLANPAHPEWRSFETFHVLSQPVYASKYPPSQFVLLAVGQLFFGRQYVGTWIGLGLAAAAVTWFVASWNRPRETWLAAIIGGFLLGNSYWAYSYFSAAPAAIGGALVGGALLRLADATRPPKRSLAMVAGLGAVILLFSRPFEGGLLCIGLGVLLGRRLLAHRSAHRDAFVADLVVPLGAVLLTGVLLLLLYDRVLTGHATKLPYMLYEETHGPMPIFVWGHPRTEPAAPVQAFADYVAYNRKWYDWATSASTAPLAALFRLSNYAEVFLVLPLALALPISLYDRDLDRRKDSRRLAAIAAACLVIMLASVFSFAHYAAPLTAIFVTLLARGVVSLWDRSPKIAKAMPFLLAISLAIVAYQGHAWAADKSKGWHVKRAKIDDDLRARSGDHLVFVTYGKPHEFLYEWVYNRADLEHDRVLWARSLDPESDLKLMQHYPGRHVWRIVVTDDDTDLQPLFRP